MKTNYITLLIVGLGLISSCAKDGGYYDRQVEKIDFNGSVLEYLKSKPGVFDSLIKVVERIGDEKILSDSTITLFAPTNQSFQLAIENLNNTRKLAEQPFEYLNNVTLEHLDTLTNQYIVKGSLPTDSMLKQDGRPLVGLKYGAKMHSKLNYINSSGYVAGGPTVINFSDTKNSQFYRYWVTTSTNSINIKAKNGVVHILTNDHVFGFNDFVKRLTYIAPPTNLFATKGGRGTVSHENGGGPNAVEASKYVFDGNRETKYLYGALPAVFYIQWEFNEPEVSNAYTLTSANDNPQRDPTDWTLFGSQNGTDWVRLDGLSSQLFEQRFQLKVYRFQNSTAYKFYRLQITRYRDGTTFQLADWTMNYEER